MRLLPALSQMLLPLLLALTLVQGGSCYERGKEHRGHGRDARARRRASLFTWGPSSSAL